METAMAQPARNYRSGDLAKLTGLSPDSIRHYERIGVLPHAGRTSGGYRIYGTDAVQRVRLAQNALKIGFTLRELAEMLRVRDTGGVPCQRVFRVAHQKLEDVVLQIKELRRTEKYLRQVLENWQALLSQAGPNQRALLLQSLAQKPGGRAAHSTRTSSVAQAKGFRRRI
jgi:DNA-binding transcriptional MerR regulator